MERPIHNLYNVQYISQNTRIRSRYKFVVLLLDDKFADNSNIFEDDSSIEVCRRIDQTLHRPQEGNVGVGDDFTLVVDEAEEVTSGYHGRKKMWVYHFYYMSQITK